MASDFLLWTHQLPTPAGIAVITALFYTLAILIGAGIAFISWKLGVNSGK